MLLLSKTEMNFKSFLIFATHGLLPIFNKCAKKQYPNKIPVIWTKYWVTLYAHRNMILCKFEEKSQNYGQNCTVICQILYSFKFSSTLPFHGKSYMQSPHSAAYFI